MHDHFLFSARKASEDKTGLDVVRRERLMIASESQQQRLRVLQCSVWECTQMPLCNHVQPESQQESRVRGDSPTARNIRDSIFSAKSPSQLSQGRSSFVRMVFYVRFSFAVAEAFRSFTSVKVA